MSGTESLFKYSHFYFLTQHISTRQLCFAALLPVFGKPIRLFCGTTIAAPAEWNV